MSRLEESLEDIFLELTGDSEPEEEAKVPLEEGKKEEGGQKDAGNL